MSRLPGICSFEDDVEEDGGDKMQVTNTGVESMEKLKASLDCTVRLFGGERGRGGNCFKH